MSTSTWARTRLRAEGYASEQRRAEKARSALGEGDRLSSLLRVRLAEQAQIIADEVAKHGSAGAFMLGCYDYLREVTQA